jgi:hypothetical protein
VAIGNPPLQPAQRITGVRRPDKYLRQATRIPSGNTANVTQRRLAAFDCESRRLPIKMSPPDGTPQP